MRAGNETWFGFSYKGKNYDLDAFAGNEFGLKKKQWSAVVYRVSPNGETITDDEACAGEVSVDITEPGITTTRRNTMFEELEKYAREAEKNKEELEEDIRKDKEELENQRKTLAKETKEFLVSLHEAADRIFPETKPDIWCYTKEFEGESGTAEILPEKTSVPNDDKLTPKAVSVGFSESGALVIALYESEPGKAKEPDKTLVVKKNDIQYERGDAFREEGLSPQQMKWILANKDAIEEAFSRSVRMGIDQPLIETERKKNSVRQNLMNAKAKIPETKKAPGQDKKEIAATKEGKKVMTEKTYAKLMDAVAWLRGWVEHSESKGIYPQERKDAAVLLDEMEKLIDRKWEKTKSQEAAKKTISAREKEPDYDGYEL